MMNTQQESAISQEVVNESPSITNLHREWIATDPEKIRDPKTGLPIGYLYGCKNFTKMKQFAQRVKLNNEQIDYWMHIGQERPESESYEDYKIRMKFQKALLKYRVYIYQFPIKTTADGI